MGVVRFPFLLVAVLLRISLVSSLRWPFASVTTAFRSVGGRGSFDSAAAALEISQREKDAIFRGLDIISTYSSSSDCLRDAVDRVNIHCDDMESSQDERVKAAISMTLCELETMEHVTIPLECRPYVRDVFQPPASSGACVESLYRSPQFWSSYSGYLRQIPQLCFAYRRWNDIDTAKDIYHNATVEKIALIKLIQRRQSKLSDQEATLSARLESLGHIEDQLKGSVDLLGSQASDMMGSFRNSWTEVLGEMRTIGGYLRTAMDEEASIHGEALASILRHAQEDHAERLEAILNETSNTIATIQRSLSGLSTEAHTLSLITITAQEEWPKLQAGMISFANSLLNVNSALDILSTQIQSQAYIMDEMVEKQKHALVDLSILATSMSQLSTLATEHIEEINATAIAVRNNLLQDSHASNFDRALHGLFQLLSFVNWFDYSSFDEIMSKPSIRIAMFLLKIVWSFSSSILSSLVSSFIVFLSARILNRKPSASPTTAMPPRPPAYTNKSDSCSPKVLFSSSKPSRITFQMPPPRIDRDFETRRGVRSSRFSTRAVSEPPLR